MTGTRTDSILHGICGKNTVTNGQGAHFSIRKGICFPVLLLVCFCIVTCHAASVMLADPSKLSDGWIESFIFISKDIVNIDGQYYKYERMWYANNPEMKEDCVALSDDWLLMEWGHIDSRDICYAGSSPDPAKPIVVMTADGESFSSIEDAMTHITEYAEKGQEMPILFDQMVLETSQ